MDNRFKFSSLLCLLLLALTVNSYARPQSETRITLKLENVTLQKAIDEIKQQSRFLFINKDVDVTRTVSISVTDETIANVCNGLFSRSDIAWTIEGDNIIIQTKKTAQTGPITIFGTIKDATGGG